MHLNSPDAQFKQEFAAAMVTALESPIHVLSFPSRLRLKPLNLLPALDASSTIVLPAKNTQFADKARLQILAQVIAETRLRSQ